MNFDKVNLLGISQQAEFFGERNARYRTIKTIDIEGYIDNRSNTDFKGVYQSLLNAESKKDDASLLSNIVEDITINGTGFGKGKIVSLDFPASEGVTDSLILYGKYSASIEFYSSGDLLGGSSGTLEGADVPDQEFLESFSEDFSFSVDNDQMYTLDHSLDIKYISGIRGNGTSVNPVDNAKILANTIFNQTPQQFTTKIGNFYGDIGQKTRTHYTETYNLIEGSTTFSKRLSILPSSGANYTSSVTNTFQMNEMGIVNVTENGTVNARSNDPTEAIQEVQEGINTESAGSFSRCSGVYEAYKGYIGGNDRNLNDVKLVFNKTINNSEGIGSYNIDYTDDDIYSNLTHKEERTISLSRQGDIINVTEKGSVMSLEPKGSGFNPYTILPSRSVSKARCQNVYDLSSGYRGELKNLNNTFTIPKYGKTANYTYAFTDDSEVSDTGGISRKSIKHNDTIGAPVQSAIIIPNISFEVLHTPGQTQLGQRQVSATCTLRRTKFNNNIELPLNGYGGPNQDNTINEAVNALKQELIQKAYEVFPDNNLIRSNDKGAIYINDVSYNFTSDNSLTINMTATFVMERLANTEYNLILNK